MSSNLQKRIITGLLLIVGIIPIILLPPVVFSLTALIASAIALFELFDVAKKRLNLNMVYTIIPAIFLIALLFRSFLFPVSFILLFALALMGLFIWFVLDHKMDLLAFIYLLFSTVYAGLTLEVLIRLRMHSAYHIFFLFMIVILTDTGAYFIGKNFGKHKLMPTLSPKKTIEGAVGGIAAATVGALVFSTILAIFKVETSITFLFVLFSVVMSVMSEFGDLFASKIKRFFDKKDFGSIFPGHGGILDRVDGLVFASITFYLILLIF